MNSCLNIRKTTSGDTDEILSIYAKARMFMRDTGNPDQWGEGYPSLVTLEKDISEEASYVVTSADRPVATFFFKKGLEPTYSIIRQGSWLDDRPYAVIHRVASDGSVRGVMRFILDYCSRLCPNLRIDTHRDNKVMQKAILSYGFTYCGLIYLPNGDERLAYQYSGKACRHTQTDSPHKK